MSSSSDSDEEIDYSDVIRKSQNLSIKLGKKFLELQSMIDSNNNPNNNPNNNYDDIGETPNFYGKTETANMMEFVEDNNDGTNDSIIFIPFNKNKEQHNSNELMEILRSGKNLPLGTIYAKNGKKYTYNK